MKKLCPVLLLPKYSGSSVDIEEVLNRLQRYAAHMEQISTRQYSELIVMLSSKKLEELQLTNYVFPNLKIIELRNLRFGILGFSLLANFKLRRIKVQPRILISGDPWRGFLSCFLLSILTKKPHRIQFQIHGNLFPQSSNIGLAILKKVLYFLAINYSTSIRVVSPHLLEAVGHQSEKIKSKIVVSPVPVQILQFPMNQNDSKGLNIGFVGRLHPERGTDLCLAIINKMASRNINFQLTVIGDGPDSSKMRASFASNGFENFVDFKGRVPNSELVEYYQGLNCLLVCAPHEGYGLSIREAVMQGLFVVALENKGTREAKELFPESVYLYQTDNEALTLLDKFRDKKLSSETIISNQVLQQKLDEASIDNLVKSWIY
jgi:glycosyltransferase involved in cell wall biosynthesis